MKIDLLNVLVRGVYQILRYSMYSKLVLYFHILAHPTMYVLEFSVQETIHTVSSDSADLTHADRLHLEQRIVIGLSMATPAVTGLG